MRFVEVAEDVVAVIHGDGSQGVANAAILLEGPSALVFDSMLLPEMARDVLAEVERRGARPRVVVNSHHHADHVGGNAAFGGAPVVGHPVSAELVRGMRQHRDALVRLMPRFAAGLAELDLRPPEPLQGTEAPAGTRLLAFTPAHSPADLAIWRPSDRVLIAADLCFNRVVPLAVHGLVSAWISALDQAVALEPAVVVPGHGPLATVDDLRALRAYLAAVMTAAREAWDGGAGRPDGPLPRVRAPEVAGWIEPERTELNVRRALQELKGEIDETTVARPAAAVPVPAKEESHAR